MTWRRDMDTSTVPRDQGLPTAWPMKERRDRNNGNTFFSNNFDFFFHPEFFSHSTTHREMIFFHPKAFVVIFSLLVPYFECLSDEDFPPKDLELQVNASFLLYVRFFPFYCIYFLPPPFFLYIFRLFSHFIHNFFFLPPFLFPWRFFFFFHFFSNDMRWKCRFFL